ncbi:MAG: hypothetical protein ACOYKE_02530 [Ferruginibacter sp.]
MQHNLSTTPNAFTEHVFVYDRLKASLRFNKVMFEHYQNLYSQHRKSRNLVRACFFFMKMKHYENAMYEAMVNNLIHELNQKHGTRIILSI